MLNRCHLPFINSTLCHLTGQNWDDLHGEFSSMVFWSSKVIGFKWFTSAVKAICVPINALASEMMGTRFPCRHKNVSFPSVVMSHGQTSLAYIAHWRVLMMSVVKAKYYIHQIIKSRLTHYVSIHKDLQFENMIGIISIWTNFVFCDMKSQLPNIQTKNSQKWSSHRWLCVRTCCVPHLVPCRSV